MECETESFIATMKCNRWLLTKIGGYYRCTVQDVLRRRLWDVKNKFWSRYNDLIIHQNELISRQNELAPCVCVCCRDMCKNGSRGLIDVDHILWRIIIFKILTSTNILPNFNQTDHLKGRQCVDGAIVILRVWYFHANLLSWRHDISTICVVTTWNGYRIMVSKMDYPMASYTINHSPLNQRITWQDTYDHMLSLHHLAIILLIVHPFYIDLPIPLWFHIWKWFWKMKRKKTLVDICLIKNTKSNKIRMMCYLICFYLFHRQAMQ